MSTPHIIILAYHFPPHRTIAAVRTWNIAKHLALLGPDVTVVTIDAALWQRQDRDHPLYTTPLPANLHVIRLNPRLRAINTDEWNQPHHTLTWLTTAPIRRLFRLLRIELSIGWVWPLFSRPALHNRTSPTLLLATGGPFLSTFLAARRLARTLSIPYVLDYRDLWTTGNPHKHGLPFLLQRPFERVIASSAALVTTASHTMANHLREALNLSNHVYTLTNGYDPEAIESASPAVFPQPAIVYAGTLYPPHATLHPLLTSLRPLDLPSMPWQVHYYGPHTALVRRQAYDAGLSHRLVCHGDVHRTVAISAIKAAHCAVVVTASTPTAPTTINGVLTGKLFEILGTGTPVLLIAPPTSEAARVLDGRGYHCPPDDPGRMTHILRHVLTRPIHRYEPPFTYCWPRLVAAFYEHLHSLQLL